MSSGWSTTNTMDEGRNDWRLVGAIRVNDADAAWSNTSTGLIILECNSGAKLYLSGDSSVAMTATSVTGFYHDLYLYAKFGLASASTTAHVASAIATTINLLNAQGYIKLSAEVSAVATTTVYIKQNTIPYNYDTGTWRAINLGPLTSSDRATTYDFGFHTTDGSQSDQLGYNDIIEKPKCIITPDFTFSHYDLEAIDANFNLAGSSAGNIPQAPFSKRFQLLRGTAAGTIVTGKE